MCACCARSAQLAGLAGVEARDKRAEHARLPPPDSLDVWAHVVGTAPASPRTRLPLGTTAGSGDDTGGGEAGAGARGGSGGGGEADSNRGRARVGGLIALDHGRLLKLLLGDGANFTAPTGHDGGGAPPRCAPVAEAGCLFDLTADAAEAHNLAPRRAATFRRLLREAQALQATVYDPERGRPWTKQACAAARSNGGFWGPFLP